MKTGAACLENNVEVHSMVTEAEPMMLLLKDVFKFPVD